MPEPKKQPYSACSSKASPEQQLSVHGTEAVNTSSASRISATMLTEEIASLATSSPEPPRAGGRLKRPFGDSHLSRALPSSPQSVPSGKAENVIGTLACPPSQPKNSSRTSGVSGEKGTPTRKLKLSDPSSLLDDVATKSNATKEDRILPDPIRSAPKPGLSHRVTHDLDMSSDETALVSMALVSVAMGPAGRLTAPSAQSDRNEGSQQKLSAASAASQRGSCYRIDETCPSSQRFSSQQTDPGYKTVETSSQQIPQSRDPQGAHVLQYRPPSDALGGNIVPKQPMPMFGRSCLAPPSLAGIGEPTPAQTVAEAQEKGEHMQVLDDAIYALDGMAPSCGLASHRESITTLAELLATRRGRAALRPDGVAQQILTAAAKLRGQSDPIIALAASSMLASLSMPDAHPSYLASSAAAVLTSQLLQADQHDIPALFVSSTGQSSTTSTSAGAPSEQGADLASDPSFRPALSRALQLATEGQLGRLLASELDPVIGGPERSMGTGVTALSQAPTRLPRSHLPLALIAMVQATSTDSSKIHFADRVKNNLRKVKALEHLATLFASRHDSLQLIVDPLSKKRDSTNGTRLSSPITSPIPVKEGSSTSAAKTGSRSRSEKDEDQFPQVSQSASDAPGKTLGQIKPSPYGSADPYDFPSTVWEEEPRERGSSKKKKKPMSGKTTSSMVGGSQTTAPESAVMPEGSDAAGSRHEADAGPLFGEHCVAELWDKILTVTTVDLLVELRLILIVLENSTFTCLQNEDDVIQMQVLYNPQNSGPFRSTSQQLSISTQGSSAPTSCRRPFLPLLVSLLQTLKPLLLPPPPSSLNSLLISDTATITSSASRCVHSCVGLLMNLTHQHKEGVKAAVEAGALLALVELLACACCSSQGGDELGVVNPDLTLELLPCRSKILNHLDLVTVCFGLLINLTSLHPENRGCLRDLSLGHLFCGSGTECTGEARMLGQHGRSSTGVVALLCSIFNSISEEVKDNHNHAGGDAAARTESMSLSSLGDEGDVTAEDLHEGHQDGEAAIVQSYSAMLLGFLVVDSEDSRSNAVTLLRSGLSAVCSSIRRCLDFYSYTGAITDECKGSLVQLLADLAQHRIHLKIRRIHLSTLGLVNRSAMFLSSDDPIVSGLHLVIQKLTQTIVEQSDRLEDAEPALQASEFLRKETASLRIELKQVKKCLERADAYGKSTTAENKSLHALVAESDAQRNSALHQVEVVSERLELTQQSNKVLQQQLDLCNLRYQTLLDDIDKQSAARAAATPTADILIQRCSAAPFSMAPPAPRVIHRSAACQTFAPACDPLVVVQIAAMKKEALGLAESLAEARAETIEVKCMLDDAGADFAKKLAEARAETNSVRQAMVDALSNEAEVTSGLKSDLQVQREQIEGLKSALEQAEGSLAATKLDLGILERKHSRAVESMVEYREQSIGLEHQLDKAIEREEAAVAAVAVVAGSFKLCRRCSSEQGIEAASLSRRSSTVGDGDPVSVMLRFGEYSDGEDGMATVTMGTSQGGESTSSFSGPPYDIVYSF